VGKEIPLGEGPEPIEKTGRVYKNPLEKRPRGKSSQRGKKRGELQKQIWAEG